MLYAINANSVRKEVRELLKAADGKQITLSFMQTRALYELAKAHKDELVQFDPDKPIVRERRPSETPAEQLPLEEPANVG